MKPSLTQALAGALTGSLAVDLASIGLAAAACEHQAPRPVVAHRRRRRRHRLRAEGEQWGCRLWRGSSLTLCLGLTSRQGAALARCQCRSAPKPPRSETPPLNAVPAWCVIKAREHSIPGKEVVPRRSWLGAG